MRLNEFCNSPTWTAVSADDKHMEVVVRVDDRIFVATGLNVITMGEDKLLVVETLPDDVKLVQSVELTEPNEGCGSGCSCTPF